MTKNASFWSTPITITGNIKNEIDLSTPKLRVSKQTDTFRYSERQYGVQIGDTIHYGPYPEGKSPGDYKPEKK